MKLKSQIGCDLINVSRVKEKTYSFFLSEEEIKLCKKRETAAGFWAVKEALVKALKTGFCKDINLRDIEIRKTLNNAPYVFLSKEKLDFFKIEDIDVSISHDNGMAMGVVILTIRR